MPKPKRSWSRTRKRRPEPDTKKSARRREGRRARGSTARGDSQGSRGAARPSGGLAPDGQSLGHFTGSPDSVTSPREPRAAVGRRAAEFIARNQRRGGRIRRKAERHVAAAEPAFERADAQERGWVIPWPGRQRVEHVAAGQPDVGQ